MDIRIVNTCNNNCIYCLEWSLRKKENFINTEIIYNKILKIYQREHITFYWWNPLLHPDLLEIIKKSKKLGYKNIGILSNSQTISKDLLWELKNYWLSSIWIYFHTFDKSKHLLTNWGWIELETLIFNLKVLKNSGLYFKIIIHINKQNIKTIWRDILILNSKFWVINFEFINYVPFGEAYNNRWLLQYKIEDNSNEINTLFYIIKSLKLQVSFLKFNKEFFWIYNEYYDEQKAILNQIWEEDIEILEWNKTPKCFIEKRCEYCFLKHKCKWYGI